MQICFDPSNINRSRDTDVAMVEKADNKLKTYAIASFGPILYTPILFKIHVLYQTNIRSSFAK